MVLKFENDKLPNTFILVIKTIAHPNNYLPTLFSATLQFLTL